MDIGNHTIVWVDAPGLVEERTLAGETFGTTGYQPVTGGVADFLQSFQTGQSSPFELTLTIAQTCCHQLRTLCRSCCSPTSLCIDRKALSAAPHESRATIFTRVEAVSVAYTLAAHRMLMYILFRELAK